MGRPALEGGPAPTLIDLVLEGEIKYKTKIDINTP